MASALFLDARFRSQIVRDKIKTEEAIAQLTNIWRRLIVLNADDMEANETSVNVSTKSGSSDISFEYNEEAELNNFLNGAKTAYPQLENNSTSTEVDINHLLDIFDPAAITSDYDIFQYWEESKCDYPELYKLAMVVLAVPPTEVQIERDFSKLNFVFSNRRCNLMEDRLEDIMVINLNSEIFYEVQIERLNEL